MALMLVQLMPMAQAQIKEPTKSTGPAATDKDVTDPSSQALQLLLAERESEAESTLLHEYQNARHSKTLRAEIPYFVSLLQLRKSETAKAIAYLLEAQQLMTRQESDNLRWQIFSNKRLADCYYKDHKLQMALSKYKLALASVLKMPEVPEMTVAELLEAIAACNTQLKRFVEAEQHLNKLVDINRKRLKPGDISTVLQYWWSLAQLEDFLRQTKQEEKLASLQKIMKPLLINLVTARMTADAQGKMPAYETLVQEFRLRYIRELAPQSPADIAWAANDFKIKSLPIIAWKSETVKPIAAIICIHGLGLGNRAFTSAAKELTHRGYTVTAIDVRGFGAWTQTKGVEEVNYRLTIADVATVAKIIKELNRDLPVFVLGESMGGAIAIRAGSQLKDTINGVIASVPSAERFQQKKMAFTTTLHFMIDPKKAFDVGAYVTKRATANKEVQLVWQRDEQARLWLTPVELTKFAVFMRTTKPHASQITNLPILMAQGLGDRLVKPQGTFELFEAVKSEDKTILVIGTAEHLMFESASPDPFLMDAVDSWLRNHIPKH